MRTDCYEPADATPEAYYQPTEADYAEYYEWLRSCPDQGPAEPEAEEAGRPATEIETACPF